MHKQSLGIYVHIPFCQSKCSYCHFLSFPLNEDAEQLYAKSVIQEIVMHSSLPNAGDVDSIYLGGGTPSLIPAQHIAEILEACRHNFHLSEDCEISLESNPGTVTAEKAAAWRDAGVTRVSMGAQSFADRELAAIGRVHNAAMIHDSLSQLRRSGFANINLDLMLGLPEQTEKSWHENLEAIANLSIQHLSVYMLDLDEHSPLSALVAKGIWSLPDEDLISDLYIESIEFFKTCGLVQYEISNFAQPGYTCRHNLKYWKREPYLGFGLGSHSFDGQFRYANCTDIEEYCRLIQSDGSPMAWREAVNEEQALQESLFLGLRLTEGVDWNWVRRKCPEELLRKHESSLNELRANGLVEWQGSTLHLTVKGMLLSNEILQMFV